MGKIILNRKHQWNNRLRQIGIYVDGKKIGTIANGEIKTFEVADGNHSIKARIDWCGSREADFLISGDEKKYFKLSGFRFSNLMMPVTLVLLVGGIVLRRAFHIDYAVWLILPVFFILAYYLTIGRNDYLTLKQTETW